jgi:hypothetical protein
MKIRHGVIAARLFTGFRPSASSTCCQSTLCARAAEAKEPEAGARRHAPTAISV